jgi:hypothetical protein
MSVSLGKCTARTGVFVLSEKIEWISFEQPGLVEIQIPLLTVSEANGGSSKRTRKNGKTGRRREYWTEAAKRHTQQKGLVSMMLKRHKKSLRLPCHITLTRYAPGTLDRHDNLPMAFKWVLDACCEIITGDMRPGRADGSDLIDVTYEQEKTNSYGVKIQIKF